MKKPESFNHEAKKKKVYLSTLLTSVKICYIEDRVLSPSILEIKIEVRNKHIIT